LREGKAHRALGIAAKAVATQRRPKAAHGEGEERKEKEGASHVATAKKKMFE
jgi:hypothetical protein